MRPLLKWTSSLLAVTTMAACAQTSPGRAPVPPVTPSTAKPPAQSAPQPPLDPAVAAMVAQGIARLDAFKTVQGQVIFDEFKDGDTDHGKAQIYFRNKPFAGRVEMLESDRWLATGGVILWSGGTQLKIKPLKMPFSLTFPIDHSQTVSMRGYRLDQTDLFSMAKVLRAPGAQIRPLGPRRMRGEDLFLLEVRSPASVPGVAHEVIGLHQRHLIPTYREMYDARGQLVHRGQGVKLTFDRPLDGELFQL